MDTPEQRPPTPPPSVPRNGPPPFQFSLAWLLIAVTALAVLLAVGQAFSETFIAYVGAAFFSAIVGCILPTPFVIAALFARGDVRVFSIGALVPWVATRPAMLMYTPANSVWSRSIIWAIFLIVSAGVCGAVAVATRRWIVGHGLGSEEPK